MSEREHFAEMDREELVDYINHEQPPTPEGDHLLLTRQDAASMSKERLIELLMLPVWRRAREGRDIRRG
jgi:hypothetical protein